MNNQPVPDNFEYTYSSIHLLSLLIGELGSLYSERSDKNKLAVVSHPMFKVFHMTLMYTVTMEYCKLLEPKSKTGNVASLEKLSSIILHSHSDFRDSHALNVERLANIKSSDFFKTMIWLRDKKFAHSDKHADSIPLQVKSFTNDEFANLKYHFNELTAIHQLCADVYDTHYDISNIFEGTERFITKYAKMRKYYNENNKTPWLD